MPEKVVITIINLLLYYSIINISYIKLLLIPKLMFIDIEFKLLKEVNYTYDNLVKFEKKTKLC